MLHSLAIWGAQHSLKTPKHSGGDQSELNAALKKWTEARGFDFRIESLAPSDFPEVSKSLSKAFLVPSRLGVLNVAKKTLIELRDIYSLYSAPKKYEKFAILGVWDADRQHLVASVQIVVERDVAILKLLRDGTEAYVYGSRLAVTPEARNKGFGKKMTEAGLYVVRYWGYNAAVLSVYVENARAREVYSKSGFEILGQDPRASVYEKMHRPAHLCVKYLKTSTKSET